MAEFHNHVAFLSWGGNIDLSILIDSTAVLEYVANYSTKSETSSHAIGSMIKAAIRKREERNQSESPQIMRTLFNLLSRRDKCTQEIAHLG